MASPLRGPGGRVIAALGISGPAEPHPQEGVRQLARLVVDAAELASGRLAGQ